MYIKNSEYLSKYTGLEIDEAIEHMRNVELELDKKADKTEIGNGTVTFVQGGVEKGSVTMNQKEDAIIDFGGGGSLATLDDVSLENVQNGQTILYDSQNQEWKNGNSSSVVFVDWES